MRLTKAEIKAAAAATNHGGRWGKIDDPGPAMAVAAMRGADFEPLGDGWARAASPRSLSLLFSAADDLADLLGYKTQEDLARAERDCPAEVSKRLKAAARAKMTDNTREVNTKIICCPECRRPY